MQVTDENVKTVLKRFSAKARKDMSLRERVEEIKANLSQVKGRLRFSSRTYDEVPIFRDLQYWLREQGGD